MDTEKQIRLNFLDEADDYLDSIESNLLGLGNNNVDIQKLDLMLRSAHSVKGGAAMMEFAILSKIAHRLEDFFKILRVRLSSLTLDLEVETLLLQGVDCLRQIANLYRQDLTIEDTWIIQQVEPIFESLRQRLGDLQEADEDALMAQDEDVDPALIMFEEGVDTILDRFEKSLAKLTPTSLAQELATTAKELIAFGQMANLEAFCTLCQSIQQQAQNVTPDLVESLTKSALTTWRRSHALVMRGRIEQLPSSIIGFAGVDFSEVDEIAIDSEENWAALDPLEVLDFAEIKAEFDNFGELSDEELMAAARQSLELDDDFLGDVSLNVADLQELQAAFQAEVSTEPEIDFAESSLSDIALNSENLDRSQPAFNLETAAESLSLEPTQSVPAPTVNSVGKMVRVPLEQLQQFNNLFEKLVQERNAINLYLKQTQNSTALMRQRMQQIEESNEQLKKWYDRASLEGIVQNTLKSVPYSANLRQRRAVENTQEQFDLLEMDRYSDLHLICICQEQIETIVQLQEVSTDIELGLQEINQAVRSLNQTTKSLQGNVRRTQMLPFAEVVKRFPRVVRQLCVQFGKQVNLEIEGENTLIDRSMLEALSDPLLHLLRNAFDHGIEDPTARIEKGKPAEGTISLKATNKGMQTIITLRDDGGGIPLRKIRDRLHFLGLPKETIDRMSDTEVLDYIFEPGFTTAERVTEISGRGVGMDVVRTNLRDIRGDIQVQTEPDRGTLFTLRIPFALSILRVAIVERSGIVFALPVSSIREILPFESKRIISTEDGESLTWNGQTISLVRLEKHLVFRRGNKNFEMTGNPAIDRPIVLDELRTSATLRCAFLSLHRGKLLESSAARRCGG